jgi:hypothetical protein
MALADYYGRAALAAAQVLEGFDERRFQAQLSTTRVGIVFDDDAETQEGHALLDLTVRLIARLYPTISIEGPPATARELTALARAVNPAIELASEADLGIAVGGVRRPYPTTIYAGSSRWDALLDDANPRRVGNSDNPFGAGVAACLAAAALFREVFQGPGRLDAGLRFSALHQDRVVEATRGPRRQWQLDGDAVLVGLGAIGNAAAWALSRAPLEGRLHLVDDEAVELSNLQRYVLTERRDVGAVKVELAAAIPSRELELVPHAQSLVEFLAEGGYEWSQFLLGLDSAEDRRSAQAALPRWIANAWTQPGDLGCSIHSRFGGEGACVACLYLPTGGVPNEDETVAQTLGVPHLQQQVRTLLHTGAPVDRQFLGMIAGAIGRPPEDLLPFEGRPIRELYVEGFCGGALVPIGDAGRPRQEMHVPLAHQSALAGMLLAACLVRSAIDADPPATRATRINVLAPVGEALAQTVLARRDGRCLCDDVDFVAAFDLKY